MCDKCFLCTKEIGGGGGVNSNYVLSNREKSFMLFQVLEIPETVNDLHEKIKSQDVNYCSKCLNRITKICDMLEELDKLEKNVLHEKYQVELHLKKKWTLYQQNLKEDDEVLKSTDQFKDEIVTELRCSSIQSMLNKMKNKQVGRKQDQSNARTNVRVMKSVDIVKFVSSMTKVKSTQQQEQSTEMSVNNRGSLDELSEPIRHPASDSPGDGLTNKHSPDTTSCTNVLNQISRPHVIENDVPNYNITCHPNPSHEHLKKSVCVPESVILSHENRFDSDEEEQSIGDPLSLDDSQDFENPLSISLEIQKDFTCGECGAKVCNYDLLAEHFEMHANDRRKNINPLSSPLLSNHLRNTWRNATLNSPPTLLGSPSGILQDNSHSSAGNPYTTAQINELQYNSSRIKRHGCTYCKSWFSSKSHLKRHYTTELHVQRMNNVEHKNIDSNKRSKKPRTKENNSNSMDISTTFSNSEVSNTSVSQGQFEEQQEILQVQQQQQQQQQQSPLETDERSCSPLITIVKLEDLSDSGKSTPLPSSSLNRDNNNVSNEQQQRSSGDSIPILMSHHHLPIVSNPIQSLNNCINNMPCNRSSIPIPGPSMQLLQQQQQQQQQQQHISPIRFHSPGHGSTTPTRYFNQINIQPPPPSRTNFYCEPSTNILNPNILNPRYNNNNNSYGGPINTNYEIRPQIYSTTNSTEHYFPNPNIMTSFRGNTFPSQGGGFPTTSPFMSHRHMMMDRMEGEGLQYRTPGNGQRFVPNTNINFHTNYRIDPRNYNNP